MPYIPYFAPKTESIHIYKKTYRDFIKTGQNMVYVGKIWYSLCDIHFNKKIVAQDIHHKKTYKIKER